MLNASSLCSEDGRLLLEDVFPRHSHRSFYMGILFIGLGCVFLPICGFVFSVFWTSRPHMIANTCYKLLAITTALDIVNLVTSSLICGFLALKHRTPCNGEEWILYFSNFAVAGWLMYSAGAEVLALNRLLVFVNQNLEAKLFYGKRCWLWLLYIIGYPAVLTLTNLDKTYVFVPSAGVVYDVEYNPMHFLSNLVKMTSVTFAYLLVLYKVFKMRKMTGNQDGALAFQIKVSTGLLLLNFFSKISTQTLVIAALADICATTYTITSYFPEEWEISQYSGLIGQLSWIILHGGTGIIYLCLNATVRQTLSSIFGRNRTAPYQQQLLSTSLNTGNAQLQEHLAKY
uniref:G_PROTEIN_RECEP_F1_2 domain-containing protein n=1 Tax=Steinernema glaseri TaxID=37863 RepID=A0A1I7Y1B0_9BILA